MNSPQSRNAGLRFFSALQFPLPAAAFAILAILISAGHGAQPPSQGSAFVTIVGPLPVPVTGTLKIDSSDNTVHVAGTVPVSFAAPTLFRGQLVNFGSDNPNNVTITNDTSQSLV